MKKYKLWKLRYSHRVATGDQLPYTANAHYLIVASTEKEALKKADKHFISLNPAMNKELLAKGKATCGGAGGATCYDLQRLIGEYEHNLPKPKLTLESDSSEFSLEPKIANNNRLEYIVTKLR